MLSTGAQVQGVSTGGRGSAVLVFWQPWRPYLRQGWGTRNDGQAGVLGGGGGLRDHGHHAGVGRQGRALGSLGVIQMFT